MRKRAVFACALAWAAAGLLLATTPGGAQVDAGNVRRFDFRIEGGRLVKGDKTIRVKQGERVSLTWSADRKSAIHLHGYDIEKTIEPPVVAEMAFTARVAGRFPIETHGIGASGSSHHQVLVYVEVHPR